MLLINNTGLDNHQSILTHTTQPESTDCHRFSLCRALLAVWKLFNEIVFSLAAANLLSLLIIHKNCEISSFVAVPVRSAAPAPNSLLIPSKAPNISCSVSPSTAAPVLDVLLAAENEIQIELCIDSIIYVCVCGQHQFLVGQNL